MKRLRTFIDQPFHAFWVTLFFLWDGFLLNRALIETTTLFGLLLLILCLQCLLLVVIIKLFRFDCQKAGILLTISTIVFLFFGVAQDAVAGIPMISFIGKLKYALLIIFVLMGCLVIWLKKIQGIHPHTHRYLNILFISYILLHPLLLNESPVIKNPSDRPVYQPIKEKPSVYLLLFDMYTGFDGQARYFDSPDTLMQNKLTQLGFHVVPHSRSNYYFTVYSMASLLHMNYLGNVEKHMEGNTFHYQQGLITLKNSEVVNFFLDQGYRINNFSAFDLPHSPAGIVKPLLPHGLQLVLQQTLYSKLLNGFLHWSMQQTFIPRLQTWVVTKEKDNEQQLLSATYLTSKKDTGSLFHYLHLTMPHDPYWFDRSGKPVETTSPLYSHLSEKLYFDYLLYTNRIMLDLCEEIKKNTRGKAIILLMSDHGYRYPTQLHKFEQLSYSTINAVYLPNGGYNQWSDTTTNVNQFRILLNSGFNQNYPLLVDTLVN